MDPGRFKIDRDHVLEQMRTRFASVEGPEDVVARVMEILMGSAPDDWRFTESPSSRFFVLDEETEAKFLGMSYRDSEVGREIIRDIQGNVDNASEILKNLESYVKGYAADVRNPGLPIVHHIRTVYGKGIKHHIAEEKSLFDRATSIVPHTLPFISRKIAHRPNAIVAKDGVLWVRQYMNWMSVEPNSKEYYLFQPLNKGGIDKCRFAVFSYSENGRLVKIEEKTFQCAGPMRDLGALKAELNQLKAVRSESYWKVPTYVDHRRVDLDFLERYRRISSSELVELYFINMVVEKSKARLCKS